MNCHTTKRKVRTAPSFDHAINTFFNSALGDVIHATASKKNLSSLATNVIQLTDKYILEIAIPGFTKEDVGISIEDEVLTVSDIREQQKNIATNYRLREFNYSGFSKSYRIPEEIDQEKVAASFSDGVLTIVLTKKEEALPQAPRTIEIK